MRVVADDGMVMLEALLAASRPVQPWSRTVCNGGLIMMSAAGRRWPAQWLDAIH